MRVLMLSKACIVGIYQRKLEAIARLGVELLALVPPSWKDERGETRLERAYTDGYRLEVTPIRLNGNFHLHFYPRLGAALRAFQPDIVHIDEEPYNLATWQALYQARRAGARTLFFSWQNIVRRYPPPFSLGERWVLNQVDYALMGTASAAQVWRAKGYTGPLRVIPQFGVDPDLFQPQPRPPDAPFTIGYFGRFVPEKGLDTLLTAAAHLDGIPWRLQLIGGGPQRAALQVQAETLGIADRVQFDDLLPSAKMPAAYAGLDAFVLPSRTRPNWKEQFGRVLVEAMASGVPVIGSDSGAIPDVIGEAGLIFPEGDAAALAAHLRRLYDDAALRARLIEQGRARVLAEFTHQRVAEATVEVYRALIPVDKP
jgi:glycosyltransferase involved in cell wall biosynthesis